MKRGDVQAVRLLLTAKASPDLKDAEGKTPLLHVCECGGDPEKAKVLLAENADVNTQDNDALTPLISASRMGYESAVSLKLIFILILNNC